MKLKQAEQNKHTPSVVVCVCVCIITKERENIW